MKAILLEYPWSFLSAPGLSPEVSPGSLSLSSSKGLMFFPKAQVPQTQVPPKNISHQLYSLQPTLAGYWLNELKSQGLF